MKLLALDTALDACAVAVLQDGAVLAMRSEPMQRGHQERLAQMVADTMAQAAVGFPELDRIAVSVGPGSFTGLRVGLAFAKGLGLALGRPCLGVGTLEAMAGPAGRTAAVLDAKRGQLYLQAFMDGEALTAPDVLEIGTAAERLEEFGFRDGGRLIGSGAALLAEHIPEASAEAGGVDIVTLGRLAAARAAPAAPPQPLYLRAPNARTLAERAADRL